MKCYINGTAYDFVVGTTFSEEYNETLDSAVIIIDQVEKLDLNPYDDVIICDEAYNGYTSHKTFITTTDYINDPAHSRIKISKDVYNILSALNLNRQSVIIRYYELGVTNFYHEEYAELSISGDELAMVVNGNTYYFDSHEEPNNYVFNYTSVFNTAELLQLDFIMNLEQIVHEGFYKHLLVDQFSEERLNPVGNLYKYKIELMSEIKKWETIALPNISITQPLNQSKKKSVYQYLQQFLSLYGTKIKRIKSDDEWYYDDKYVLDDSLEEIFGSVYCPDFTLTNPSLRELFNQLFLVKDCIPYIVDDVVYAMNITKRNGTFDETGVTQVIGSKSSSNYADALKRTYQQALSEENTARRVEYLGFRNSDTALLTIDNMRVETQYPIYKINKIYMCYYKKVRIYNTSTQEATFSDKAFLCKQDITPLVKLEQERAILSQDWDNFTNNAPETIEEMAKYKLCTVGYSIGGNTIEGWGTKYSYPSGWWSTLTKTKTYIENLFTLMDKNYPLGIYSLDYISKQMQLGENEVFDLQQSTKPLEELITPYQTLANLGTTYKDDEDALKLKSFFFQIDYEAFYNGTVIHAKDNDRDDISINDNSSSALTLLEKDGIFQKEKVNRFGNEAITITARYSSLSQMQPLGSVYGDDNIIYHREYSIFNHYVNVVYYATKDYVLRNYFVSVYAKHRPYALINYNDTINRAENRKSYLILSKDKCYYEDNTVSTVYKITDGLGFYAFGNQYSPTTLEKIVSFFKENEHAEYVDDFKFNDKINVALFSNQSNDTYAGDLSVFVTGYSLCFNVSMKDNISMGQYVKNRVPFDITSITKYEDHYTGSTLDFYSIVDDNETGFIDNISIGVGHIEESDNFKDILQDYDNNTADELYNVLDALPYINVTEMTNQIGNRFEIYKDNKEVLDFTFQIEVLKKSKDIYFSEWLMKLCDLYGVYNKIDTSYSLVDPSQSTYSLETYLAVAKNTGNEDGRFMMVMKIPNDALNDLINNFDNIVSTNFNYEMPVESGFWNEFLNIWSICGVDTQIQRIKAISTTEISFDATIVIKTRGWWGSVKEELQAVTLTLHKVTQIGNTDYSSDANNTYFSNINTFVYTDPITQVVHREWTPFSDNPYPRGIYRVAENKPEVYPNENLSANGFLLKETKMTLMYDGSNSPFTITYDKNLFIRLSGDNITEQLVFDELPLSELAGFESTTKASDVFDIQYDNGRPYLYINLGYSIIHTFIGTLKSIQLWYNHNGALKFVFGANVTQADITKGEIRVYLSLVKKKDTRVFNNNNVVIGEVENYLETDNVYGIKNKYVVE